MCACSDEPPEAPPLPPPVPLQVPPPPATLPPTATSAPDGYPANFPFLPGGEVQAAQPGPAGLVTFTIAYPQAPAELQSTLQAELEQAGWAVEVSPPSPRGTQRMNATREGQSVQVSVLPGPNGQGSGLLLIMM
jgi:hypothetical protein